MALLRSLKVPLVADRTLGRRPDEKNGLRWKKRYSAFLAPVLELVSESRRTKTKCVRKVSPSVAGQESREHNSPQSEEGPGSSASVQSHASSSPPVSRDLTNELPAVCPVKNTANDFWNTDASIKLPENLEKKNVLFRCLFQTCIELIGKVFETSSEEEMAVHLRTLHMNWLPFVCGSCGGRMATRNHLRLHFASQHPQYDTPTMILPNKDQTYHSQKNMCKELLLECQVADRSDDVVMGMGTVEVYLPLESHQPLAVSNSGNEEGSQRNIPSEYRSQECSLCSSSSDSSITLFVSKKSKWEHAKEHLISEGRIGLTGDLPDCDPTLLDMLKRCFCEVECPEEKDLVIMQESEMISNFLTGTAGEIQKELEEKEETSLDGSDSAKRASIETEKILVHEHNVMQGIRPCSVIIRDEDRQIAEEAKNEAASSIQKNNTRKGRRKKGSAPRLTHVKMRGQHSVIIRDEDRQIAEEAKNEATSSIQKNNMSVVRRKRGRPRKAETKPSEGDHNTSVVRRKRGRPRKAETFSSEGDHHGRPIHTDEKLPDRNKSNASSPPVMEQEDGIRNDTSASVGQKSRGKPSKSSLGKRRRYKLFRELKELFK